MHGQFGCAENTKCPRQTLPLFHEATHKLRTRTVMAMETTDVKPHPSGFSLTLSSSSSSSPLKSSSSPFDSSASPLSPLSARCTVIAVFPCTVIACWRSFFQQSRLPIRQFIHQSHNLLLPPSLPSFLPPSCPPLPIPPYYVPFPIPLSLHSLPPPFPSSFLPSFPLPSLPLPSFPSILSPSFLTPSFSPPSLHVSLPSFLPTSLPPSLPSLLPPSLPSFLPSFLPSSLPSFPPSLPLPSFPSILSPSLPDSFLLSSLSPCLPSFLPPYLPSSLPSFSPSTIPSFLPPFLPSLPPSLFLPSLPSSLPLLPTPLTFCLCVLIFLSLFEGTRNIPASFLAPVRGCAPWSVLSATWFSTVLGGATCGDGLVAISSPLSVDSNCFSLEGASWISAVDSVDFCKRFSISSWKCSSSFAIAGLFRSSVCCLIRFLACVNDGGSCSSSKSIFWNSSTVSWLEGVSLNSPSLFLMVVSLIRTTFTTSRTVLLKLCKRAATRIAATRTFKGNSMWGMEHQGLWSALSSAGAKDLCASSQKVGGSKGILPRKIVTFEWKCIRNFANVMLLLEFHHLEWVCS